MSPRVVPSAAAAVRYGCGYLRAAVPVRGLREALPKFPNAPVVVRAVAVKHNPANLQPLAARHGARA